MRIPILDTSFIIRTKNEERWIAHCLAMLYKQDYSDFGVILIDNTGVDHTVKVTNGFLSYGNIELNFTKQRGVMITFRREHLDKALDSCLHLIRGRVLDVGGVKGKKRRGRFTPPLDSVVDWKYLNQESSTNPDYCCSAEKIPLDAGSVDTIIMTEVLEYLKNPNRALGEVCRVLSENGVALISVPLLHAVHGDWQEDRQRFTAIKLKEMAVAAGYKVIEIRTMGGLGSVIYDLIHVAGGYANKSNKSLATRILYKATKVSTPFFHWLDRITLHGEDYITTGYFIVLRKGK